MSRTLEVQRQRTRQPMQRQCAWCLRLISDANQPISSLPLPKLYEATHGMCCECGARWVEEMMGAGEKCSIFEKIPLLSP
jgi:hypothetical protein